MDKSVNLRIDSELWQNAKVQAAKQGVSLRQLVEQALKEKLERLARAGR